MTDTITTIDGLSKFWRDLDKLIERTMALEPLPQAGQMMGEFLDDHRGLWPKIKADVELNAEHEAMLATAFSIRSGYFEPRSILERPNPMQSGEGGEP